MYIYIYIYCLLFGWTSMFKHVESRHFLVLGRAISVVSMVLSQLICGPTLDG